MATRIGLATFLTIALFSCASTAADIAALDPKAISITLPDQIQWTGVSTYGAQTRIVAGDPAKAGFYAVLVKWNAGHMSHPHFHDRDRFITVVSGTWWVGTGDAWDPNAAVPMPPGSLVTHYAKQVHWDGAKDNDAVILIVGMGPDVVTPSPTAH